MQTNRVVYIVLDGLRYDVACRQLGYVHHLIEYGQMSRWKVKSELPSLSRPLYETLLTGTPPHVHGVTTNETVRRSREVSLFDLAVQAGRSTAAFAYYWVSELYSRAPFCPWTDRIQKNLNGAIEYGSFYYEDHYPDTHLFAEASCYIEAEHPDFVYIHSMNIDDAGHREGANSQAYEDAVLRVDQCLARCIPRWRDLGYDVVITSDHGMTELCNHGGTTPADRDVPLFVASDAISPRVSDAVVRQVDVAPFVAYLLGIPSSPAMTDGESVLREESVRR